MKMKTQGRQDAKLPAEIVVKSAGPTLNKTGACKNESTSMKILDQCLFNISKQYGLDEDDLKNRREIFELVKKITTHVTMGNFLVFFNVPTLVLFWF